MNVSVTCETEEEHYEKLKELSEVVSSEDEMLHDIAQLATIGMLLQQIACLDVIKNYPDLRLAIHNTYHLLAEDSIKKMSELKTKLANA